MKWSLVFMLPFFIVVAAKQCKEAIYSVTGRYLKDHVISSPNVKDIGLCFIACSQDQRCRSINFQFHGSVCELNDADKKTHPWDYELKDGWAYSDYPVKVAFNIKEYYMTPLWLKAHATYMDSSHSITEHQITFYAGSLSQALLLKVPLVAAGDLSDETPLTVQITVAIDISIGQSEDSDQYYGLSDGTDFMGFVMIDPAYYHITAPCTGNEATSGVSLRSIKPINHPLPLTTDTFYPEKFVLTFKLDMLWGSCFTAHDGGYNMTAEYSKRLKLSRGLTLEVYKDDPQERVGIKYIKVNIMKTGG